MVLLCCCGVPPSVGIPADDPPQPTSAAAAAEAATAAAAERPQVLLTPTGAVVVGIEAADACAKVHRGRISSDQRVSLLLLLL